MPLYPPTHLDGNLVLRYAFDDATQTLRTTATAVIVTPPALEVLINMADDSVRLGDGTNFFTSTQVGPKNGLDINIINTSLNINLPTGASTSALQLVSNTSLASIDSKLPTLGPQLSANSLSVTFSTDQTPLNVNVMLDAFTGTDPDNVMLVGSLDGTKTGTKYGFVNNVRQQVLASHDRDAEFTYADFGTINQRVTRIDYTSATFPGIIVRKDFIYSLVINSYRLDDIIWSIV